MFPGHHNAKNMAVRRRAQSGLPPGPTVEDTVTTMVYEPIPSTAVTNLRASQIPVLPHSPTIDNTTSQTHMSDRELAFVITAALLAMGVLLLVSAIVHLLWRRRRHGRLPTPRASADTQEQGLNVPRDFDDSSWGMDDKCPRFQEYLAQSPCLPTPNPSILTPHISHLTQTDVRAPNAELTTILEQFERRLLQEEKDIALALDIAFGHDTLDCAPFFGGSEDDVTTMLSLQAGLESVGKRAAGVRNRARQGSDASASSQSTTMTIEGFASHNSSNSSLTSMESMISEIDESAEEAEEEVYEVKRAQTHSMEIQKGKLIAWQPGGVRLMVTGPSTATLATASSSVSVDLAEFPSPPPSLEAT
ncbi:hypothetical protein B0H14DRAFT_3851851 [Mycena olivaceomarginata]|nr:hypothetical protein B0H14DRAFT_3851851 [Mycena olivaceomarginata]